MFLKLLLLVPNLSGKPTPIYSIHYKWNRNTYIIRTFLYKLYRNQHIAHGVILAVSSWQHNIWIFTCLGDTETDCCCGGAADKRHHLGVKLSQFKIEDIFFIYLELWADNLSSPVWTFMFHKDTEAGIINPRYIQLCVFGISCSVWIRFECQLPSYLTLTSMWFLLVCCTFGVLTLCAGEHSKKKKSPPRF